MTHINAYVGDLEEKKVALVQAQAAVDAAQAALEAHPDFVAPVEAEKPKKPAKK